MWSTSLTVNGVGYLHELLALGSIGIARIVSIPVPRETEQSAQAIWLECKVDGDIKAFLSQYEDLLESGQAVIVEFTAELLENRTIDNLHNIVTWDANLQRINQVYVNGAKQFNSALTPSFSYAYH